MTNFTNIDLKKLPKIDELKISEKWNYISSYGWVLELLTDYYLGISNIEGKGWLVDNWWKIEPELIKRGRIAVVYYGTQFLIAEIIKLEKNFENKITNFQVRFLGDSKIRQVISQKEAIEDKKVKKTKKPGDIDLEKVVIFRNNPFERGDFVGLSNETQKMDIYLELIRHDLEMTKQTLTIKTKGKLSDSAESHIVKGLATGKLVNIYYEDRRTKQPVDPNSYSYELKQGDIKQRSLYWEEYYKVLEGIKEKYKIRHIDAADKFSRTNNPEVYSNLAIYWAWEKQRSQVRENSLREFSEKFPQEGEYKLKYGFIFTAEQSDKNGGNVKEEH